MNKKAWTVWATLLVLSAIVAGCSMKSEVREKIEAVSGIVYDLFGEPKAGVVVELGNQQVTTSTDGSFSMRSIEIIEGPHHVTVTEESNQLYSGIEEIVANTPLVLYVNDNDSPIVNPGFELGLGGNGLPFGWTRNAGNDDWITLTNEESYSGEWSLLMEDPKDWTSGWGLASELIPVEKGKTYEISSMVKLSGPRVQLYMQFYNSDRRLLAASDGAGPRVGTTNVNDEWTPLTISGEVPQVADYIRILLYMAPTSEANYPGGVAVKAYFDHVTFQEIDTP